MSGDDERAARAQRAAARRLHMTVEVVALGTDEPPPYAHSSPAERIAAAVRLIAHHQALRGEGASARPPRSEWPGEKYVVP